MKQGQTVTLVTDHQEYSAIIVAVTDSGPSGYKTLTLAWEDENGAHSARDIVHERDQGQRSRFWREGNPRQNQAGTPAVAVADEESAAPKKATTTKK